MRECNVCYITPTNRVGPLSFFLPYSSPSVFFWLTYNGRLFIVMILDAFISMLTLWRIIMFRYMNVSNHLKQKIETVHSVLTLARKCVCVCMCTHCLSVPWFIASARLFPFYHFYISFRYISQVSLITFYVHIHPNGCCCCCRCRASASFVIALHYWDWMLQFVVLSMLNTIIILDVPVFWCGNVHKTIKW